MEKSHFKIAIIGLGIIGGSMAYALNGFKNAVIHGCDTDIATRQKALKNGAVHLASSDSQSAVTDADLVILCTFPEAIADIIEKNRDFFKPGAVVTDVCGVKTELTKKIEEVLPEGCHYVGGHPMAGKETHGFDSASPEMFDQCGYIITLSSSSAVAAVELVREMAQYIGAAKICVASPSEHDSVIAYTSDLMHISASALCLEYNPDMNCAYTAGAFRDCTRIANINPELWSQLFLKNRDYLLKELDIYINSLERFKTAIEKSDKAELAALLSRVRQNKLDMLKKEPM